MTMTQLDHVEHSVEDDPADTVSVLMHRIARVPVTFEAPPLPPAKATGPAEMLVLAEIGDVDLDFDTRVLLWDELAANGGDGWLPGYPL